MELALQKKVGWEEALLVPIGDLQLGAEGSCPQRLRKHIELALKHPNPWFLGMGDYIDFMSPSNRQRMKAAALYDDADKVIESAAQRLVREFLDVVRGTEGRWLAVLEGHHFWPFLDGTTSDMRIADALKAPPGGTSAFVGMRFSYPKGHASMVFSIACHHGQGSGKTIGAPLNKAEDFDRTARRVNMVLIAHYTRMPTSPADYLFPAWKSEKIEDSTIVMACTGGWYLGYAQGSRVGRVPRGGYVEKAGMRPATVGAPVWHITPVHSNGDDYFDVTEVKRFRCRP